MYLHKRLIYGEIHAVTTGKDFTQHEMYEWLVENGYIDEEEVEICQSLWDDPEVLSEVGERMINN